MNSGDLVVMPLKNCRQIAIGRVTGPYEFRGEADPNFRHVRPVEWLHRHISRDAVRSDLLQSMGSLLTVCGLTRFGAARRIAHLAEHGSDPGPEPDERNAEPMATPYDFLNDAAERAPTNPSRLRIRDLLSYWGAARRTSGIVARIEADLTEKGLTTRPPFTEGWIDNFIELVPVGKEPDPSGRTRDQCLGDDTEDASEMPAVTLRVGALKSAASGVTAVLPDAPLSTVMTHMLANNYSQLAVIDDAGVLWGAVSWESIGKARMVGLEITLTQATAPARVVEHDEDLLSQIEEIYAKGFVFVRGPDRTITGIITAADLTEQFGELARPFVLVEEAERRLRRRVDEVFDLAEIRCVAPRRPELVNSAADLVLGSYERLLNPAENWRRLGWSLDHALFLQLLRAVREIRNELMHFTPDPLNPQQLGQVEGFVNTLRIVDPRP
jgi:restriction system protein